MPENSAGTEALVGQQIEDVSHPNRPTLRLVRRRGDPAGAVAAAVFTEPGSLGALAVLALLLERMGEQRLEYTAHSLGVVVSQEVIDGSEARVWLSRFHRALAEPVHEGDPAVARARSLASQAGTLGSSASILGQCMGVLGSDTGNEDWNPSAQELEEIRAASFVAPRIGLAALGSSALLEEVTAAHDERWPQGSLLDDRWDQEEIIEVSGTSPAPELRVAVRVQDVQAALAGARSLRRSSHPFRARLRTLDPHLRVAAVDVTLRPAGACAGITLIHEADESTPPLERMAAAAVLAKIELSQTVQQAQSEDETTLALLAPEHALEAASLAAWTSVRARGVGHLEPQSIIDYRAPPQSLPTAEEFRQEADEIEQAWGRRRIPFVERSESGQAEAWLLVASPCGTVPELLDEAGLRALTVHSLAADFDGKAGVRLEPWVTPGGIGLLAHAPFRRNESPPAHGARLARAVAAAFAGPPIDGRDVANQRSELLDRVGSDPGRALMRRLLAAGRPSLVDPYGLESSLATASAADVERVRAELAREPLRAAFLANRGDTQVHGAEEALSEWLAPIRDQVTPCPELAYEQTQPGTWTLQTIEGGLVSAHIGVWMPAPRELGKATEFLLNRPGGYLDQALAGPALVTAAEAHWLGGERGGGLIVELRAPEDRLAPAVHQARAVLDALASGAASNSDAQLAELRRQELEGRVLRSPRGRIVQLWRSSTPAVVTTESLRQFHRALAAERHLLLEIQTRK